MHTRTLILVLILSFCLLSISSADITDRSWAFIYGGNNLGWLAGGDIYTSGVVPGYWWGQTSGYDPWFLSPDYLSIPANTRHYVSVKMRIRFTSSPTDRFGPSDAQIYFSTNASPNMAEDKRVSFKAYGNGAWKVYNVKVGTHSLWQGTIKQIRVDPCGQTNARIEIEYIKIMRDTDPPVYSAENLWTYEDGETTNDTTPTVHIRNCYDQISGVDRAEFYYRPGASTSDADWVLAGIDASGTDGYQLTYPTLTDGMWDLGVKVYDKAGNAGYWANGDDRWIDNLTIDSSAPTQINVDAALVGDDVPKEIFGHNIMWYQWSNNYNATTGSLPAALENRIADIGLPVFRYPGGCFSDTFYWKKSIGPVASRPTQYTNGCNKNLYPQGAAKFGLDEFLRYCEQRNAKPMFTCRFRWPGAPPAQATVNGQMVTLDGADPYAEALADAVDLVEYCNSPNDGSNPNGGTDWAAVRVANGHPAPYHVKYFEIGNEPWGPDPWGSPGNVGLDGPTEYSLAFVKYQDAMKAIDPTIVVSATSHISSQLDFDPINTEWAWNVYEQVGGYIERTQIHPYLPYSAWQKNLLLLYDETMATPKALDDMFATQRTAIKITTPEKEGQIKLRFTEWNINYGWIYDPSQGRVNMYHVKTLKVAVALADAFKVFIENRDIIESGEWWHLYGGLFSCIDSDANYSPNPAYHSFRIFNKHFGDKLVRTKVIGSPVFDFIPATGAILKQQLGLNLLTAIASKSTDGKSLYLVVINKDRVNAHSSQLNISNFITTPYSQVNAEIWELNGPDVDDYTNVNNIGITESSAVYGPSFTYSFPAHSVTSFKFTLAPVSNASIGEMRGFADGTAVQTSDSVVTALFPPNVFYIEEPDRSSGIRVESSTIPPVKNITTMVSGVISTNTDGERTIAADSFTTGQAASVYPLAVINRPFDDQSSGLKNLGLLVKVWGKITGIDPQGAYFYIDDGSQVKDGTQTDGLDNVGIRINMNGKPYAAGQLIVVTGISACVKVESDIIPAIRVESQNDIRVISN